MTTTGIGLYFALRRRITQHGWDHPLDWHVLETVVWTCTAMALLIADIANQLYERRSRRSAPA